MTTLKQGLQGSGSELPHRRRVLRETAKHLSGDLVPTFLAIAVLIFMKNAAGVDVLNLLAWPEWSFGAIVLYGLAMEKFFRLKIRVQGDFSTNIETGGRAFLLALVVSVLWFSLAVLHEEEVVIQSVWVLSVAQLTVMGGAVAAVGYLELQYQERIGRMGRHPWTLSRSQFYDHADWLLAQGRDKIQRAGFVLSTASNLPKPTTGAYVGSRQWTEQRRRALQRELRSLEDLVREIQSKYLSDVVTKHSDQHPQT